jgi:hypothetical protein
MDRSRAEWTDGGNTMWARSGKRIATMSKYAVGGDWKLYVSYHPRIDDRVPSDVNIIFSERRYPTLAEAVDKCDEILGQEWQMTQLK